MKLFRNLLRRNAKPHERNESSNHDHEDGKFRLFSNKNDCVQIPTAFLILGVMFALLLALIFFMVFPTILPNIKNNFLKPVSTTTNSTTFGTFEEVGDLYTARIHECDVLKYSKDKREMTMILRYHVNAFYDLSKVQITTEQKAKNDSSGAKPSSKSSSKSSEKNTNDAAVAEASINIVLPRIELEVVTEKFAGLTGKLSEGDLPGIEIFDYKGNFTSDEDDYIANAFLELYKIDTNYIAQKPNQAQTLNEIEVMSENYVDNIQVLVENNFDGNIQTVTQAKRKLLIKNSEESVVTSLEKYYSALGYSSVTLVDANGVTIEKTDMEVPND